MPSEIQKLGPCDGWPPQSHVDGVHATHVGKLGFVIQKGGSNKGRLGTPNTGGDGRANRVQGRSRGWGRSKLRLGCYGKARVSHYYRRVLEGGEGQGGFRDVIINARWLCVVIIESREQPIAVGEG